MGRQFKVKEAALACSIALSLALQITGAAAFSTETVTPPQNGTQAAPATPFGQPAGPGKDAVPTPADALAVTGKPNGTEVTIPGIGSVGTLPKLDFGLELLYGPKSTGDATQLDQRAPEAPVTERDMQIKGTLSHKF